MIYYNSQQGISLYLAIVFMSIILAMILGLTAILIGQLKVIKGLGDSVIAFYAADTGIEQVLTVRENPSSACTKTSPCSLGDAEYYLEILDSADPKCNADNYCIKSVGIYNKTQRAIEITY